MKEPWLEYKRDDKMVVLRYVSNEETFRGGIEVEEKRKNANYL